MIINHIIIDNSFKGHKLNSNSSFRVTSTQRKDYVDNGIFSPIHIHNSTIEPIPHNEMQIHSNKHIKNMSYSMMQPRLPPKRTSQTFPVSFPPINRQSTINSKILKFYLNKIQSEPLGDYIENILNKWKGDYNKLEINHGYIQWLFPIYTQGKNNKCPPIVEKEAACIF